jgi:hypothetical protein
MCNTTYLEYPKWWEKCKEIQSKNASAILLLPADRREEFQEKEEWLNRRSVDLMLYRLGEKGRGTNKAGLPR